MENNYGEGGNPPPPAAPKRRAGAPRGNRNALKAGRHTAEAQARRRQRAALAREVRLVLHYLARTQGVTAAAPERAAAGAVESAGSGGRAHDGDRNTSHGVGNDDR